MAGKTQGEILRIAQDQFGFVTASDARAAGIDPVRLPVMKKRGFLEHISRGVYRVNAIPITNMDEYMGAFLWTGREGVVSHDTALDLHDLCDVNPMHIHLTVPMDFRTAKTNSLYKLHKVALSEHEVQNFDGFPIVKPYRAIKDGIQSHLGWSLMNQAINTAEQRGLITSDEAAELQGMRVDG